MIVNDIYEGSAFDLIKQVEDASIDLIVTSPPYANQRKAQYGGANADQYSEWFIPLATEFYRVLKPTGSCIINIKEHVIDGERSTYVMDLVKALRQHGWRWVDEYLWHKKNPVPGYWPNRLRDGWEHIFHFTKQKHFAMYQEQVKQPIGDWAKKDGYRKDERIESASGSPFGSNHRYWSDKKPVLPSNVLHVAVTSYNRGHCAPFPRAIPEFFIKLFTQEGDLVLDPFMGSGTTAEAARDLNRDYLGFELMPEYVQAARTRLHKDIIVIP